MAVIERESDHDNCSVLNVVSHPKFTLEYTPQSDGLKSGWPQRSVASSINDQNDEIF